MSAPSPSTSTAAAGIASLGLALPPLSMDLRELARLRGVDPDKYTIGLGCDEDLAGRERIDAGRYDRLRG